MRTSQTALALMLAASSAAAAPVTYAIDPSHTFPSFEADHLGISIWRGKFNRSRGTVLYDKSTGTGTVEIVTELASIDFGLDALATWARGKDFFDVKKHPRAVFKGRLQSPVDGVPTLKELGHGIVAQSPIEDLFIGGIVTFQDGFPNTVMCGPGNIQNGGGYCKPDAVAGAILRH